MVDRLSALKKESAVSAKRHVSISPTLRVDYYYDMAEPDSKPIDVEADVEDVEEDDSENEAGEKEALNSKQITAQVMKNPQILAALQEKLGSGVVSPSDFIRSLPGPVRRRLKALKKLQNDVIQIESSFYKEVHDLESRYSSKYSALFDQRRDILTGSKEPNDEECDWPSDDEKDDDEEGKLADELKEKAAVEDKKEDLKSGEDIKGIPGFWLTVFKNVDILQEMIQEHDEPILNHLRDIRLQFTGGDAPGFTLEFHFTPNDYFTESVLTKHYTMRFEPETSDPFGYEGPEIIKCVGCPITWKKGKNVTLKVVKKKQKHKGRGTTRTVTKTVQNDSFFNFFDPPLVPEGMNEDDMSEDMENLLAADFEIGHFIRERIIPRAALYFTGEALDSDEYDEDEGEEEDEGDLDEENDADYQPGDRA